MVALNYILPCSTWISGDFGEAVEVIAVPGSKITCKTLLDMLEGFDPQGTAYQIQRWME